MMKPLVDTEEWAEHCQEWYGRILSGEFAHYCADWDDMPLDENVTEFACCTCYSGNQKARDIQESYMLVLDAILQDSAAYRNEEADAVDDVQRALDFETDVPWYTEDEDDDAI
jgi:hypothetical protein